MENINFAKVKQVFVKEGEVQSIFGDGILLWQYGDPDQPSIGTLQPVINLNEMEAIVRKDTESPTTIFISVVAGNRRIGNGTFFSDAYLFKYNKLDRTLSAITTYTDYDISTLGIIDYVYDEYNSILYRYTRGDTNWQESSNDGSTFTTIEKPEYKVLACLNDIMFGVPYNNTEEDKNSIYYFKNSTWNKLPINFDYIDKASFYYINNTYIIAGLRLDTSGKQDPHGEGFHLYNPVIAWSTDLINWEEKKITSTTGDYYISDYTDVAFGLVKGRTPDTTITPEVLFLNNTYHIAFQSLNEDDISKGNCTLCVGNSLSDITVKDGIKNEIPNAKFIGIVGNYYAFYRLEQNIEKIVLYKNLDMTNEPINLILNTSNSSYNKLGTSTKLSSTLCIPVGTNYIAVISTRSLMDGYPKINSVKTFISFIEIY